MAFSHQTKPLRTFKILCEALKLPTKNCSLILPVLLLSFLSSSILFIFKYLSVTPLATDLTAKTISIASVDPKSPEYASLQSAILKDSKEFVGIEAIFLITSFIIYSIISFATIHVLFSSASSGTEFLTPKDLLCRLGRGLKGPMITRLYVSLLNLGYILLLVTLIGLVVFIAHGSMVSIAFGVVVALLGLHLYLNLAMVWSVSTVISVVEEEEGCYGVKAISKAAKIIGGRRRQGAFLNLILLVIVGVVSAVYHWGHSTMAPMVVGLVYAAVGALTSLFEWAVIMVFYCDCKESNNGEGTAIDGGFMYSSLPKVAHDDVAYP